MKLGLINSAWVQADQPTTFGLQKTKEIGFDTVDIFADPLDIDVRERRLIKDECDRLELPIVSIACVAVGLVDFNPSVQRFHVERVKRYLDLAYEFQAANVLLVLGEYIWQQEVIPPAEQWQAGVDNCRRLGDYAAGLGLEIALELEPFRLSLVNSVDTMVRFLDDCGHPAVKANIDISHLVLAGAEPRELRRLRGKAAHVHISDCDGKVHGDLPPGRGVVPFAPYLKEIKELEIDGAVSIELEYSPQPEKIVEWVAEAYRETDKLMQAAGLRELSAVAGPKIDLDLDHLPPLPRRKKTPIGCVGAGFIMADCHLVAYRQAGFRPLAIASRSLERAQQVAARHEIPTACDDYRRLLDDPRIEVLDIAVPPDIQLQVVEEAVQRKDHIRGILAQKPLGMNYAQAKRIVQLCRRAGITLAVNQNMRFDHSIRACKNLLGRGCLGQPVLATIDMRAIPHWMPWQQRLGWLTLRIMSIHHLDAFRYLFGDPVRVLASVRRDPRTTFKHQDGICLYILEYSDGLRAMSCDDVWAGPAREGAVADNYVRWRVEGDRGMAQGTIGWPAYPARQPSTLDFTTAEQPGCRFQPRWDEAWFPDAFVGPMADLLIALERGQAPTISGADNLNTMALVDACYLAAKEHRAVTLAEAKRS